MVGVAIDESVHTVLARPRLAFLGPGASELVEDVIWRHVAFQHEVHPSYLRNASGRYDLANISHV